MNFLELDDLIDILAEENIHSFLEIGSETGISLRRIAEALPANTNMVCVDLPHGYDALSLLKQAIVDVEDMGHTVTHIIGDSTDPEVVEKVKALGPFDACFIDANHALSYVTQDWQNYGPMCRIVAFHDIGWANLRPGKTPIEVPQLWNEIKQKYRSTEIRRYHQKYGIGVLWRE